MNTGAEQTLQNPEITYSILDPTGNITALVESPVDIPHQPAVAEMIMKRHRDVEQVGFVRFHQYDQVQAELRMAGGEFCGNASLCTAALYLIRNPEEAGNKTEEKTVRLKVSGAKEPVTVRLTAKDDQSFHAGICMPPAEGIEKKEFRYEDLSGILPVVRMEGISHILIEEDSVFFSLKDRTEAAEAAVRRWCSELSADGLGLMFLEMPLSQENEGDTFCGLETLSQKVDVDTVCRLTPLVYIPGGDTVFWENSCASGSAACGMALAAEKGTASRFTFRETGGDLIVISDPFQKETWLYGSVRLKNDGLICPGDWEYFP